MTDGIVTHWLYSQSSSPGLTRWSTPFLVAPTVVDGRNKSGHDGVVASGFERSQDLSVFPRRTTMSRTLLIALCLGLVALCGGRARANLVVNGGFETENLVGGVPVPPPPGWTITGDGVSIDTVFPHTGTYDIAFATPSTDPSIGMLSQAITTSVGQNYTLT